MSDAPRCVYCRARPAVPEWRPFCSERCKMADLGRWLSGGYRIAGPPVEPAPPEADDDEDEPDRSDG
jgi:endogenous inhibitor of DNA gyrase (YacG/DUF329 family)